MRLYVRIMLAAVWINCLLAFAKLPRVLAVLEARKRHVRADEDAIRLTVRTIERIARLQLFVIRNNCLRKSLLLYYFLLRAGVDGVKIHIGISKKGSRLEGHCWLTRNGGVYLDSEQTTAHYKVIYSSGV